MDARSSTSIRSFLPTAVILMALGWGGLYSVMVYTTPSGGTRWAFFFALVLAVTGTSLPAMAYFNRRFPTTPPATAFAVLRQALWVGVYISLLLWLQIGHVLSASLAFLLAIGLGMIEYLLRLRDRAQWKP